MASKQPKRERLGRFAAGFRPKGVNVTPAVRLSLGAKGVRLTPKRGQACPPEGLRAFGRLFAVAIVC